MFLSHNERDLEVRKALSEKVTSQQIMTRYMGIQQDKHGGVGQRRVLGEGRACVGPPRDRVALSPLQVPRDPPGWAGGGRAARSEVGD